MYFLDRTEAAERLANMLMRFRGENPLVIAIPRGAVPMAQILADRLNGDLDVVLVHKIGAPDNPEFAIGSVSEFGNVYRSHGVEFYGISEDELEQLAQTQLIDLKNRRKIYSPLRPPISPTDRTVIIVDDGIATGSTMVAAVRAMRFQNPKKIVVAAPVASVDASELLRGEADELVVLDTPFDFFSISQFYENFSQVSDGEVERILTEAGSSTRGSRAA